MEKRIQPLFILSLWLMTPNIVACAANRVRDTADRIPLDESPPVVPILKARFSGPLEKCPDTDDSRDYRLMFFDPPTSGHVYHCGETETGEIIEFFYPKFPCRKGLYGAPENRGDGNITLRCQKCPEDRFNPELRWSPENMDQCRTHFHKQMDEHAIEYLPGNSSAPAVSYCNYHKGWASANKEMFCRQSYQPCNCVYSRDSCPILELLPDGSCESWCDGQRLPENNFSCSKPEPPQTQRPSPTTRSKEPTSAAAATRTPTATEKGMVTEEETGKDIDGPHTANNLSPGDIVGIVIGCIFFVALLLVIYKKRDSFIICNRTKNIHGDYYKNSRNKKVIYTRKRACRKDDNAEGDNLSENDDNCLKINAINGRL